MRSNSLRFKLGPLLADSFFVIKTCPHCFSGNIIKFGFYRKKLSKSYIQKYKCKICLRLFSPQTNSITKFQKKSHINKHLFLMLCSGVSLRRCALNLNVHFMTAYMRFLWLGKLAQTKQLDFIQSLESSKELYLDEMESIEHTKLKPVTIPLLIDDKQRILGITSGEIPAKGYLAEISRKKYGSRASKSSELIHLLLNQFSKDYVPKVIKSDGKKSYVELINSRWSDGSLIHNIYENKKSDKSIEQLYLNQQKKKFDPLFAINQRCAKLRSDVKRLVRRSWCTTKKIENLNLHLQIYACYNNQIKLV